MPRAGGFSSNSRLSASSVSSAHTLDVIRNDISRCQRQVRDLQRHINHALQTRNTEYAQYAMQQVLLLHAVIDEKLLTSQALHALAEDLAREKANVAFLEHTLITHSTLTDAKFAEQARDIAALRATVAVLTVARDPASSRKCSRDEDAGAVESSMPKKQCALRQAGGFLADKLSTVVFEGLTRFIHVAAEKAGYALTPGSQPLQGFKEWLHRFVNETTDLVTTSTSQALTLAASQPSATAGLIFASMIYKYLDPQTRVAGSMMRVIIKSGVQQILYNTLPFPINHAVYAF